MRLRNACVVVVGSWGTALATVLADNDFQVTAWTRSEAQATEINERHENHKYLPGCRLPENIKATTSMEEALHHAELVLLAAPSSAMRDIARQIAPYVQSDALIVHATKGFETDTLKRMTTVIGEEIPAVHDRLVVLSGPSHAEEVIKKCPTTTVVASQSMEAAKAAQDAFFNSSFRVYTNPDVIGVEVSGALKNIIALGAGLSDGLGFGDNAKAALITRGLAEISRLGVAMGANPMTFAGLSGVGDLIVTCTSKHSRNWRAGYMLAQSMSLTEVLEQMGMVVEGIKTTKAAYALSLQYGVTMPITMQLHQVLFEGKSPRLAVEDLMERVKRHELEGQDITRIDLTSSK